MRTFQYSLDWETRFTCHHPNGFTYRFTEIPQHARRLIWGSYTCEIRRSWALILLQFSFEEAVLKGLAPDNGLFIPEEIPSLPPNWLQDWLHLSFEDLAFQILSLYISPAEISSTELKAIIRNSYSTFRVPDITPTIALNGDRRVYLLELFHGPTL